MKVVAIIQARLSSSRLPGKILLPLAGTPLLAVLVERTRRAAVHEWWVATSTDSTDDLTAAWGDALGLRVHRGSLEDVLSRFTDVVRMTEPDWVVRLTADDPFTDSVAVDALVSAARRAPRECCLMGDGLGSARHFPLGYLPQIVRAEALLHVERSIPDPQSHHRAHVVTWLLEGPGYRSVSPDPELPPRPGWRWTIDTAADYEMAAGAFELFGARWPTISYAEMVCVLDEHPELACRNASVRQKTVEEG